MAASLSWVGALPVAWMAACCESFQLSLFQRTLPLPVTKLRNGFASAPRNAEVGQGRSQTAHQHLLRAGTTDDKSADENVGACKHLSTSGDVLQRPRCGQTGKDISCSGIGSAAASLVAINSGGQLLDRRIPLRNL
jgi:hypothetical protein